MAMRPTSLRTIPVIVTGVLVVLSAGASPAVAHEPIFSVGPRTIWLDGLGLEVELEREHVGSEEVWALHYEALYGVTENQAFTLEVPQVLEKRTPGGSNAGFGDVLLRYKWRFFRKDVPGGAYQAAVMGGVELPTGESGAELSTGSGTTDVLVGASADWEGRRWLLYGTGRYKRNGTDELGVDVGDTTMLDAAVGLRPIKTGYLEPDTVVMAELNYESHDRWRQDGIELRDTGGDLLFVSIGTWITYRNHAFKPGIRIPLFTDLHGVQEEPDWVAVLAYEVHVGSLLGR